MVKKISLGIIIGFLLMQSSAEARRLPPSEATHYYSPNNRYEIGIKEQTITDGPCKAIFKRDGQIIWERGLPSTPGIVHIANDGQYIAFVNWGWADEGGFKSVSFCDGNGNILKEIPFKAREDNKADNLRWIRKAQLTLDGHYFVVADSTDEITLYDAYKQEALWDKRIPETLAEKSTKPVQYNLDDIQISDSGGYLLTSRYNSEHADIVFIYLDKEGDVIWSKKISAGYPVKKMLWVFNIADAGNQKFIELGKDGLSFKIYSLPDKRWLEFENISNKVTQKK